MLGWFRKRVRSWIIGNALTGPTADAPVKGAPAPMTIAMQTMVAMQSLMTGTDQLAVKLGSKTLMGREVSQYTPPPGIVPTDTNRLAFDQANHPEGKAYDSGQNFNGMQGWLNTNYCGLGFPGYAYLSELAQRSEYRAPSEAIADEATRCFIRLTTKQQGDKADKIAKLEAAMKRYDVRQHVRTALLHDLFFGRGTIFIDIEGQDTDQDRAKPLVISSATIAKGSLKGFTNI